MALSLAPVTNSISTRAALKGSNDCDPAFQLLSRESGDNRVWHFESCVQAILSQTRIHPDGIALRGPRCTIDGTYRELSYLDFVLNAKQLAKRMICFLADGKKDGLKGKTIAILLPRDVDFVGKLYLMKVFAPYIAMHEYD